MEREPSGAGKKKSTTKDLHHVGSKNEKTRERERERRSGQRKRRQTGKKRKHKRMRMIQCE